MWKGFPLHEARWVAESGFPDPEGLKADLEEDQPEEAEAVG